MGRAGAGAGAPVASGVCPGLGVKEGVRGDDPVDHGGRDARGNRACRNAAVSFGLRVFPKSLLIRDLGVGVGGARRCTLAAFGRFVMKFRIYAWGRSGAFRALILNFYRSLRRPPALGGPLDHSHAARTRYQLNNML